MRRQVLVMSWQAPDDFFKHLVQLPEALPPRHELVLVEDKRTTMPQLATQPKP